ncbi:MAG: diiron oxygenase [Candidatus Manganitrophaceae bacterium]
MGDFAKTVEKLCEASKKEYANPYSSMEWPEALDPEGWFMSPELISIYGMPAYDRLTEREKKRLSFYETVNFFSLNIHGEKSLVEGLARQLYQKGNQEISPYLHHFLDEENKHMIYFGGFCTRYAGKIYRDRKMVFPRDHAPGEEGFLFFAKVLIFEEIVDAYNVKMSKDGRLAPIARQINLFHHRDEARHLVFGRHLVKDLFHRCASAWSDEVVQGVRGYLASYFSAVWKEYYNPDVYKDAGLEDPYRLQGEAFESAPARAHRRKITEGCIRYFLENNILQEEPVL